MNRNGHVLSKLIEAGEIMGRPVSILTVVLLSHLGKANSRVTNLSSKEHMNRQLCMI